MTETSSKSTTAKNSAARQEILASISKNLAKSEPFDAFRREHHVHSMNHTQTALPTEDAVSREVLIDRFCDNLGSVGGHSIVVSDEFDAAKTVGRIIEKLGAGRVAISDSELIGRVIDTGAGTEFIKHASRETLFECDLGITSAQRAIAETGTLVLESTIESHRLTSLVPPVHLCVVEARCIRQTLGEILALTSRDLGPLVTFVTGASRTSDIELTLAIGVHGPGELYVIVIADR